MDTVREELTERFSCGSTVPGTRSFHYFEPVEPYKITYKRTAEDESFSGVCNMSNKSPTSICCKDLKINDYVACRYGVQ